MDTGLMAEIAPALEGLGALYLLLASLVALALTELARKITATKPIVGRAVKALTPPTAILFAVFVNALLGAVTGHPVTWSVVGAGFLAGFAAVAGHTSAHTFLKHAGWLLVAIFGAGPEVADQVEEAKAILAKQDQAK